MQLLQKIKASPVLKKWLVGIGACLLLYTVVGFLILPPVFKWLLVKKLSEQLHRQVTIEDVDVNPYMLSSAVKGLEIKEREGT